MLSTLSKRGTHRRRRCCCCCRCCYWRVNISVVVVLDGTPLADQAALPLAHVDPVGEDRKVEVFRATLAAVRADHDKGLGIPPAHDDGGPARPARGRAGRLKRRLFGRLGSRLRGIKGSEYVSRPGQVLPSVNMKRYLLVNNSHSSWAFSTETVSAGSKEISTAPQ